MTLNEGRTRTAHSNTISVALPKRGCRFAAVPFAPATGRCSSHGYRIILSVRGNSEAWVIDHFTTTAQAAGHTGGKPGGEFEMGDHHNFVDPAHPSDELPVHKVWISPLFAGAAYDAIRVNCGITGEDSACSPA